jgi:transcriptional regulator with PAS, ATPase and Fis domain
MKRNAIAPFRLVSPGPSLSSQALQRLSETPGFTGFLDMLVEPLLVLDATGRLLARNHPAEALLGIGRAAGAQTADIPETLSVEFRMLAARATSGTCRLPLKLNGQTTITAIVHALTTVPGQAALRLVTFEDAVAETTAPAHLPGTEGAPLLYQARLEPVIALGVKAFRSRRRILLLGETGVGKTTLISSMHRQVHGPSRPFMHVNCSSISETLFEAEMFGYERGAFTGALAGGKMGFVEAANGGTLFLDEVGELALHQQAKLLKFLEDGTIQPVGSVKPREVDVYVVCATNRDLWKEVRERRFREDLYYRIAMIPVEVPALRQHPEELPVLIDTLIANINLRRTKKLSLTRACRDALVTHDYPGNMRELLGVIARLDLLAEDSADVELLPPHMLQMVKKGNAPPASGTLKEQVRAFERQRISEALRNARSKRQAAKALGIDIASLLRKTQDR